MQIIVDVESSGPVAWAVEQLSRALQGKRVRVDLRSERTEGRAIVVGMPRLSQQIAAMLQGAGVELPEASESLVIHRYRPDTILIAGSDERGLVYGLMEAARSIELAEEGADLLDSVSDAVESPELPWRSMQLFLCNEELEREWFYREGFWDKYLGQLARCRYNNFSLTFAHQTPYLAPPYPFLVELPEFPRVRTPGTSREQKRANLEALRMISGMAQERGLHFTLAVWSQHAFEYGQSMVRGLDLEILADCNAVGLARVLEACPAIDGVQFRMNIESGIEEDEQVEFYERQFHAIAACGRPIRLDLRAKGLTDETIECAQALVPDTVVSTKFWCEHLGMPYVMPAIQQFDVNHYRRYGTWDLLKKPRTFPLVHRLWSAGTQRVLLWGDPEWVRRFVRSCHFGGDGFEVMAPLTNKGMGGEPGTWRVINDRSYQPFDEEYERYWMFYLLFGRLGYSSRTDSAIWRRELAARFGRAAGPVERAYSAAGQISGLLTTLLQWSASLWRFWPETFAGRSLEEDADIEPSDPTQFYGVLEYVEGALAGELRGKWTPFQSAEHLKKLALEVSAALSEAGAVASSANRNEFRGTVLDLRVYALLAEYHAERLTAGVHLSFYKKTHERSRLLEARARLVEARGHWSQVIRLTDGVHHDDLVFGHTGPDLRGHWKNRLAVIDHDLARLQGLIDRHSEEPSPPSHAQRPGEGTAERPHVAYELAESVPPGEALPIRLSVQSREAIRAVRCHYRAANQSLPFEVMDLEPSQDAQYVGSIPPEAVSASWDLMVFFEVVDVGGEASRYPDWRDRAPYHVIATRG